METEITISFIMNQMRYMGVCAIWIDDECVWDDNYEIPSDLTLSEEVALITENKDRFLAAIRRDDLVVRYIIDIVDYHHSVIHFYTVNYKGKGLA